MRVLLVAMALAIPQAADAQLLSEAATAARRATVPDSQPPVRTHMSAGRLAAGMGLSILGSLGGGMIAAVGMNCLTTTTTTGGFGGGCGTISDDEAVLLVAALGALGSSIGVAAPRLDSPCSGGARLVRSVAGSVMGAGVATIASTFANAPEASMALVPMLAPLGGAFALRGC